jgi:formylglycine-generating enzyme required for sulfatase activity
MYKRVAQVTILAGLTLSLVAGFTPGTVGTCLANENSFLESLGSNAQGREEYRDVVTGEVMVKIPEGSFLMGSGSGDSYEWPVHEVYLDGFLIDKYEVTNTAFCAFLNDMGNQEEGGTVWLDTESAFCLIENRDGSYQPKEGFDLYPVVEVTWYGARAYARWAGKRLPTEAEWEKAVRGGLVQSDYPWGNDKPQGQVNYSGYGGELLEQMPDFYDGRGPLPVGSFIANGYGLYDMVSNVFEWCADWYSADYYRVSPTNNPQGPEDGQERVVRMGSWHSTAWGLRCSGRYYMPPQDSNNSLGFRCARSLSEAD